MPNWNKSMKCRAWPSVSWKTIKKASQPASHWSWSTWWQLVEQVLHLHLHLQLQLQLGKSKTEKANLTSCFHAGQKDQDQDQDVARSACRKCGNVHFIAEIYSCAETRWWFMYVLALRALCAIGIKFLARIFHEVIMANGLLPCSSSCPSYFSIMLSVWLLIEKKVNHGKLCDCNVSGENCWHKWVKLEQMLQLFACFYFPVFPDFPSGRRKRAHNSG